MACKAAQWRACLDLSCGMPPSLFCKTYLTIWLILGGKPPLKHRCIIFFHLNSYPMRQKIAETSFSNHTFNVSFVVQIYLESTTGNKQKFCITLVYDKIFYYIDQSLQWYITHYSDINHRTRMMHLKLQTCSVWPIANGFSSFLCNKVISLESKSYLFWLTCQWGKPENFRFSPVLALSSFLFQFSSACEPDPCH